MKSDQMIAAEEKRVADEKERKPELPGVVHNSEVSGKRLKSFIERIERLSEEKRALSEDISDIYKESKGAGFEPKIIRKIVSLRKVNIEKRREEEELLELYKAAIGIE